ncbi:MAG: histidine kinase [Coriobacteriales bacterium]|nr:histidine kinase [Coriobacteriales bacterium]
MIIWSDAILISMVSAALLLSVLGLWFTAIIPGIDRWNRRFFWSYFSVIMLCCVASLADMALSYSLGASMAYYCEIIFECLVLSLPLLMPTVYLLHCCEESIRQSRLLHAALALWAAYIGLGISALFVDGFTYVSPENTYVRGPLYPIFLLPLVLILLLNLVGTIKRKNRLSRKVYNSFLIAILPMTLALIVQMFIDVFPLIDISYVLSTLAMFGLVVSDQIERNLMYQQEIANQRASIMVLQMRPHFIYNTLMTIYSLCNQDPQKARQVTADFTDYLRKNFNAVASENTVAFSAELEHTRAYLAVEQAQHEEMLLVDYDTQFTRFRVPPLTLQPIVENAVKHGMSLYVGPLRVAVRTYHADHSSVIVVEDNGPGFDVAVDSESHTTLTNIRQRLDLMCSGTLEIKGRDGGGTVVTITIPDRSTNDAISASSV